MAATLVVAGVACSASSEDPAERTTSEAQAIQLTSLTGSSLPAKTLALTFDDGPGSRTLELSSFLKSQGIQATFFVNGRCFIAGSGCGNTLPAATILAQVKADGHLIGNHTQDHLDLTTFSQDPAGDALVLSQVTQTDAIIAPYVDANHWLFRAPFGYWNSRDYGVLHASAMDKYVGPINWNAGGAMSGTDATGYAADWDCWQNKDGFGIKSSSQCATRYLNEIHAVGHGIVLMHDVDRGNTLNNHDPDNGGGNTVDMVKLVLVPQLKAQGYTFVRADAIPAITTALGVPPCDASCMSCAGPGVSQCTACRAGRYLAGGMCSTCSVCGVGSFLTTDCSANADTVCTACGSCDDGDECTTDACDTKLGCVHEPIAGCVHIFAPSDAGADADADAESDAAADAGGDAEADADPAPDAEVDAASDLAPAPPIAPDAASPPPPDAPAIPAASDGCSVSAAPRHERGFPVLVIAVAAMLWRRRRALV